MENMNIEELVEDVLWDEVSSYVEGIEEFKKMVENIAYIEQSKVDEVKWCEVFETEEFCVMNAEEQGETLCVAFEMPFILSCWSDETQIFRVTACVEGKVLIEQEEVVEISEIKYSDVEVDSVYLV